MHRSPDSALTPMNAWLPQAARVYLRRLSEADNAAAASAVEGLERTSVPAEVRDAARQGLADLEARLSSPLYYSFLSSAAAAVEPPSQVAPLDGSISRLALDVLDRVRR
jgi:pyrroloquinoline quinone (PQQ) biosynthesis protein C